MGIMADRINARMRATAESADIDYADRPVVISSDPWGGYISRAMSALGKSELTLDEMDGFRAAAVEHTGMNIKDTRGTWMCMCDKLCDEMGIRFLWPEEIPVERRGHYEGKYPDLVRKPNRDPDTATAKIVASSDAEYLAAAEAGDTAKCQEMVDQAAKAAGYTVGPVWHGTDKENISVFKIGTGGRFGKGIYFAANEEMAKEFGKHVYRCFLSSGASKLPASQYLATSPSQVKLADPITRDDSGNIIPLSKRFNSASNDIRASRNESYLHSSDTPISKFSTDNVAKHQIFGVYFSKPGIKPWGNRKVLTQVSLDDISFAPQEVAKSVYLEEMGNGGDYGKATSLRLQEMGYDGADLGKNEVVVWNTDKIKIASNDIRASKIKAEGRRYKSGLENYVLHSDLVGDITVEKMARKIEQKRINSDKDKLFNSVMGSVNQTLLNHMILTLPSGTYLLHTRGRAAPHIGDVIMEKYGVYAGIAVDERVLRGLAALYPERISVSFTHGLEEISIKDSENRKMNLQEKYKALRASGRISATGRTEEILAEDDWVRVKRMAVPEIDADSYIFTECKRETAVCIVRDADGRYLMRNEATLQSNFTPAPKVMTETLEEGETAEQAVIRGLIEEFGAEPESAPIYLGSINGTFQELHNYHLYLVEGIAPAHADLIGAGEGDGSRGEERSNSMNITEEEWAQVKDFISWIAYGMMRQYDNRNILGRAVCL